MPTKLQQIYCCHGNYPEDESGLPQHGGGDGPVGEQHDLHHGLLVQHLGQAPGEKAGGGKTLINQHYTAKASVRLGAPAKAKGASEKFFSETFFPIRKA